MKTVFSTQEGVKMNADLDLGSTENILQELKYFLELSDNLWGVALKFYYHLTDDGYIQLAYSFSEDVPELIAQYKLRYKTLRENLTFILRHYFEATLPYQGVLNFERSPLFIEEEYDTIIQSILSEDKANSDKAKETITPLITFLEEQDLSPRPSGDDAFSWLANCPSGGNHPIKLVTTTDDWWCGYCKKDGKLPELKAWLSELK